ncbi:MAG: 30S ribosomal protein S18 [Candidatus Peregrinibacteria bacterium]
MPSYKNRKCRFCEKQMKHIDYKNIWLISKFITKYKKITPRYYTGTCLKHQKQLSTAIKRARLMALVPFTK